MKKFVRNSSVLVVLVWLAGCGGVGGSSSAAPPAPATLTGANMDVAAQEAVVTSFMPAMSSEVLVGAQTLDERVLFTYARVQMDKLPSYMANVGASNALVGAVSNHTELCTVSGSLTVSVNDADNSGSLSSGDSMSVTFNSCVETNGALSGALMFTFDTLTGNFLADAYKASMTMSFDAFAVTASQFSASANGSLTLVVDKTALNEFTSSVSTPSLAVSGTYAGVIRTRMLSNYTATRNRAPDVTHGYLTTHTFTGSLTSTALGSQTISFATPAAFVIRGTDYYPSTGVLLVTGANNAKLRITAVSNANVTLELDADGNGSYEVGPNTVAWNTLT